MSVALLATACALADPEPGDLERYLNSLQNEERVRVEAAEAAKNPKLATQWREWCKGARGWLRNQCLGIEEGIPDSGTREAGKDGEGQLLDAHSGCRPGIV